MVTVCACMRRNRVKVTIRVSQLSLIVLLRFALLFNVKGKLEFQLGRVSFWPANSEEA